MKYASAARSSSDEETLTKNASSASKDSAGADAALSAAAETRKKDAAEIDAVLHTINTKIKGAPDLLNVLIHELIINRNMLNFK